MQMRCKSYMYLICKWPVYGSYMTNPQFLQPTYTGLIRDIYGTYKGHIRNLQGTYKSLSYIPYKPHIGETVVPGIFLFFDKMHIHNR